MKRIFSLLVAIFAFVSMIPFASADSSQTAISSTSKDLILIIPGIMCSELKYGSSTKVWVPSASNISTSFSYLAFGENGTPNFPNSISVLNNDNYGTQDIYETIYDNLYNNFASSNVDVKFFAYDWRYSCASAASSLSNFISNYTSGKIILIAHSMGGLVASQFLKNATSSQRSRTTLITIGTPFRGATKTIPVLQDGALFYNISDILVGYYVKPFAINLPSVYQLLPTSNHTSFLMIDGVTKSYNDSMNFLKSRSWAIMQNGSVKPQFNISLNFMNGLGYGNNHKAYLANKTYHIVSNGYDTPSKVNYSIVNGDYSITYITMNNNGDGTVLAVSGQNAQNGNNVFSYYTAGNHTGMLSNSTILNKVDTLISAELYGSASSNSGNETDSFIVNEKGWIVGRDIDNKRIVVNLNQGASADDILFNGLKTEQYGEDLCVTDCNGNSCVVGTVLATGIGVQYFLKDGEYKFHTKNTSDDSAIIVRYMDDGYYTKIGEYSNFDFSDNIIEISDSSKMTVSVLELSGTRDIAVSETVYSDYELMIANK